MNYLYIKGVLSKIFTSLTDNMIVKAALSAWLFFAGIHVYIYAVVSLLLLDVFTGIYASLRNGEPFTSKILKQGLLEKLALYMILLLTAFTLEHVFKSIYEWKPFLVVYFVTILISAYECISICENILKINPRLTFLKSLIGISEKVQKGAIKFVEKKIDDVELPDMKDEDKKEDKKPDLTD